MDKGPFVSLPAERDEGFLITSYIVSLSFNTLRDNTEIPQCNSNVIVI